jgi:Uma2 family endonuclease
MMTLMQAAKVPTPQEILHAQDEGGVEFINGEIVEKPVSKISSNVAGQILTLLNIEIAKNRTALAFDSSLGYQCFTEDPRKFRKPDVSVIRDERLATLPPDFGLCPIPADLAIEVNSPTDIASNVEEKVDEYLGAGFPLVWVVDPPTKSVTIHRADGSVTRLREKDEITGESALPTFKCKVAEFFVVPK